MIKDFLIYAGIVFVFFVIGLIFGYNNGRNVYKKQVVREQMMCDIVTASDGTFKRCWKLESTPEWIKE